MTFALLFIFIILIWKFIDNLFELNKKLEKYPKKEYQLKSEYQLESYVIKYVKEFWGRAFDFKGKTRRKDFWLTLLQGFILSIFIIGLPMFFYISTEIYNSVDPVVTANSLSRNISYIAWLIAIINLIPSLSIQIRRLNDIGKEPAWVLLSFVPFISFLLIFWYAKPSLKKGSNLVNEENTISRESTLSDLDYAEESLLKLRGMLEKGIISDEEFKELRKRTLGL